MILKPKININKILFVALLSIVILCAGSCHNAEPELAEDSKENLLPPDDTDAGNDQSGDAEVSEGPTENEGEDNSGEKDEVGDNTSEENPDSQLPDQQEEAVLEFNYDWDKLPLPMPPLNVSDYYTEITSDIVKDKVNNREWNYSIYLPPSYDEESERIYPVIYVLHCNNASSQSFASSVSLKKIADYCHRYKNLPEIIIVAPDAQSTYFLDDYQENTKYEQYFFEEFLPYIETTYRISSLKENTVISGASMGGYGAAYYGLKHKEKFGLCYIMTAPLDGQGRLGTVPSLFDYLVVDQGYPYLVIDEGKADYFVEANFTAIDLMEKADIPHTFFYRNGAHDTKFWKEGCYMLFLGLSLRK